MKTLSALSSAQKALASDNIDIVKWAIYRHIKVNESIVGLGYDDLFQEGCLCLCNAAATYDGAKAKFITYAQVVVKNGLLTYCKKMSNKYRESINIEDLPVDSEGMLNSSSVSNVHDKIHSDDAVFNLLNSMKSQYSGVTRMGIEALELKVKGYSGAEIAELWGVEQNHVGAWISRAKDKLRKNEQFTLELQAL